MTDQDLQHRYLRAFRERLNVPLVDEAQAGRDRRRTA